MSSPPSVTIIHAHESLAALVELASESVDAVLTDPPYSSGGAFRGDRMRPTAEKYVRNDSQTVRPDFSGDNRDQRAYAYWSTLWLSECLRIAKPSAPLVVFSDWRQLAVTIDMIQAGGWVWRGVVPWDKGDGARPMMGGFRAQCEYVVWGTRGPLDPRTDVGCLQGLFRHTVKQDDKFHIAGKPTALMRDVVRICPPGGVILDPFAGSFTTLVAAYIEGRSGIGIERDLVSIEQGRRRLADLKHEPHESIAQSSLFTTHPLEQPQEPAYESDSE